MKRILNFILLVIAIFSLLLLSACGNEFPAESEIMANPDILKLGEIYGLYSDDSVTQLSCTDLEIKSEEMVGDGKCNIDCSITFADDCYERHIDTIIHYSLGNSGEWLYDSCSTSACETVALKEVPYDKLSSRVYDQVGTFDIDLLSFEETEERQEWIYSGTAVEETLICTRYHSILVYCSFNKGLEHHNWNIYSKTQGDTTSEWKYDVLNGFSFTTNGMNDMDVTFHKFDTQNKTVDMSFRDEVWENAERRTVPYEICNENTSRPYIKMYPRGSAFSALLIYPDEAQFGFYGGCIWN